MNFFGFLQFFENLGSTGDNEGIGLLTVRFHEEFLEVSSASGNHFLFSDISREFGVTNQREINQKSLASKGFNFRPHEVGFIGFGIEGGKNGDRFHREKEYTMNGQSS